MKTHQSTQRLTMLEWPEYIEMVNPFTNEVTLLKFFGQQPNRRASYRQPIKGGIMHSDIPHTVAKANAQEECRWIRL